MKEGLYSFSVILLVFILLASFSTAQDKPSPLTREEVTQQDPSLHASGVKIDPEILLQQLTPRQRVAQLFFAPVYGNYMAQGSSSRLAIERLITEQEIGGLIMMSGDIYGQAALINDLQTLSRIPLWITQDMEFGAAMRIRGSTRITPAMGVAATGDIRNAFMKGKITAKEAKAAGVHQIFAPVLDVNNNPKNPAINIRSFSSDPKLVSEYGTAFIQGIQSEGLVATAKHFPGHGDTETDSHLDLPVVPHDYARLDSVELIPFSAAIEGGVQSIMTAHISFPQLSDSVGLPGTLDPRILTDILKDSLGFEGVIVTDGLGMKGISNYFSPGKAVVAALKAGADLMLMSPDVTTAIDEVMAAVEAGELGMERVDESVLKLLNWKASHGLFESNGEVALDKMADIISSPVHIAESRKIAQQSITVLRNESNILPINPSRYPKLTLVNLSDSEIGSPESSFIRGVRGHHPDVSYFEHDSRTTNSEELRIIRQARNSDLVVLGAFTRIRVGQDLQLNSTQANFLRKLLASRTPIVTVLFGNPYLISSIKQSEVQVIAWSNASVQSEAAAASLFGATDVNGRLPIDIPPTFGLGDGIHIPKSTLHFGMAEEAGMLSGKLAKIDGIMHDAIKDSVFPGGVVSVVKDGILVYNKAFGYVDYEKLTPVQTNTPYDLASVTKILATTTAIMHLVDRGLLDLDTPVSQYVSEFRVDDKAGITIRDLLNHESGLPAFKVYVDQLQDRASIIEAIKNEPLEWSPNQKYVYSDLGLILLAEIIEQVSGQRLDSYVRSQLHYPMGMFSTFFTPKKVGRWYAQSIPPTEIDTLFRMELVQADVHDERAYYMDGVAGHAGLFSNSIDIAKYITFLTNKGFYTGQRFISSERIDEFTSTQESLSKRGLGFDKKSRSGFSSAGTRMSPESFGHTGFTGTSFWVDPEHRLGVIVLTNRVHPYRSYGARISRIRAAVADAAYESMER